MALADFLLFTVYLIHKDSEFKVGLPHSVNLSSLEISTQTHPEMRFTDPLGISQSNQIDTQNLLSKMPSQRESNSTPTLKQS